MLALAMSSIAIRSTPASSRPTRGTPSSTAMVAGVTPRSRSSASKSRAASEVARTGQPVADDGRLEGDDGPAVGERVSHFFGDQHSGSLGDLCRMRSAWLVP